jgi:hypothetical protein
MGGGGAAGKGGAADPARFWPGGASPPGAAGQGPSGRCLAVLPGAPPASPHLANTGLRSCDEAPVCQGELEASRRKDCLDGPRSTLAKGSSSGWPTECRLVASSFRGFDRSHLADESPT